MRNDEEIATLAGATISQTFEDYSRCFNKDDEPNGANDIFEIRHASGNDGANIHVSIVDEGTRTDLLFGRNADLDSITMNDSSVWAGVANQPGADGNYCLEGSEAASRIKFQNAVIIESQCVWNPTLWTQDGNCFVDSADRILDGAIHNGGNNEEVRHEFCLDFCSTRGYRFMGVQAGNYCFCGSDAPTADPRPDNECNMACQGDTSQMCGGIWRMNVYAVTP